MQDTNLYNKILKYHSKTVRKTTNKEKPLVIKPLEKWYDADIQALYNFPSGIIKIGCEESQTAFILWHEQFHKLLYESLDLINPLKASIQWDKIDKDIENWITDNAHPFSQLNFYHKRHYRKT